MTDQTAGAQVAPKTKRGGYRPGAGRPAGRPNNKTLRKRAVIQAEVAEALAAANDLDIESMTAVMVLDWCMKRHLRAGDLSGATSTAALLAPYQAPRVATMVPNEVLPEDMQPDPEPIGDDPDAPPAIEGDDRDDERLAEYYARRAARRRQAGAGSVASDDVPPLIE